METLQAWHDSANVQLEDVRDFCRFHPDHYLRNVMHSGPAYQALVLCWGPGQRSLIQDHTGSSCAVKVVQGVAIETLFDRAANGMIFPVRSHELAAGSVTGSEDTDIHQISNLNGNDDPLVTLHIYSPSLLYMNAYSLTDAKISNFFDPVNDEFVQGSGI